MFLYDTCTCQNIYFKILFEFSSKINYFVSVGLWDIWTVCRRMSIYTIRIYAAWNTTCSHDQIWSPTNIFGYIYYFGCTSESGSKPRCMNVVIQAVMYTNDKKSWFFFMSMVVKKLQWNFIINEVLRKREKKLPSTIKWSTFWVTLKLEQWDIYLITFVTRDSDLFLTDFKCVYLCNFRVTLKLEQ